MTQKYEKVDLGNVRGKNGQDGVGIEEFRFITDIDPTTHLYHVVYTDEGKAPTEVILHDGDVTIVERALENYIQKSDTVGLLKNDGTVDTTSYSTFDGDYNNLTHPPNIPNDVAQLTDNNNTQFTPRSHIHGEIQNNGTIDNQIITFDNNDVPLVADYSAGNVIKLGKISTDYLIDPNSHETIGSYSNDTVSTVLQSINNTLTSLNTNITNILNGLAWKTYNLQNMTGCNLYYNDYLCHFTVEKTLTISDANKNKNVEVVSGRIPEGYRPKKVNTSFMDGQTDAIVRYKVTSDGVVYIVSDRAWTNSTTFRASFTWARIPNNI